MEIVTVPEKRISDYNEYLKWAKEQADNIARILHVKVSPSHVGYGHEYTVRNGVLYLRNADVTYFDFFQPAEDDEAREIDAPEVMCTCGNVEFTLRYGCYELRARCTRCGTEGIVYDG